MKVLPLVFLAAAAAAPAARAQVFPVVPPAPAPRIWRFFFVASVGLARRQDQPWTAIHTALDPSGWDAHYPVTPCFRDCAERPSQVAAGYPATLTLSGRARLTRLLQLRAFAGTAPLGHYPGAYTTTPLAVHPTSKLAGLQAVLAWRGLWAGAGPTINFDRVTELAGNERQRVSGTRAGLGISVGAMLASRGRWFVEVSVERRMSGALDLDSLQVPGAPTVPPMRVSLSHTLLNVGVGVRR